MGNDAAPKKYREIRPVKDAEGMLGTVLIEFADRCVTTPPRGRAGMGNRTYLLRQCLPRVNKWDRSQGRERRLTAIPEQELLLACVLPGRIAQPGPAIWDFAYVRCRRGARPYGGRADSHRRCHQSESHRRHAGDTARAVRTGCDGRPGLSRWRCKPRPRPGAAAADRIGKAHSRG